MIRHVSGIGEIVTDVEAAVGFYESLGLTVKREADEYAVVEVPGVLHFGIWSRGAAAESTLGDASRADEIPLGFSVAFEVDEVDAATKALSSVVRDPADEPWGQRTVRFRLPSGALSEFSETPWARSLAHDVRAHGTDDA